MKRSAPLFFWPAVILLLFSTCIALLFPREQIHMVINRWHSPFLDYLFRGWTHLGGGWVIAGLIVLYLFIRIRISLVLTAAYAMSGISAQLLKKLVFREVPRPVKYFELHNLNFDLYLVPGVKILYWNSFPSGHAAAAFGMFFGLALFQKKSYQWILLIVAAGVAYSRMYLSQHFLMDVAGGMFLGLLFGWVAGWWIGRYQNSWIDKPLSSIIFKR